MRLTKLYHTTTQVINGKAILHHVPNGQVKVIHAGPVQHFSTRFVEQGIKEGWLTMAGGQLHLIEAKGKVSYEIVRTPGRYPIGKPPGYEVINYYDCKLVKEK